MINIYDLNLVREFIEKMFPVLGSDEVIFVSASLRNKYLTTAEREYYSISGREMFNRKICLSTEECVKQLVHMDKLVNLLVTKNNKNIPLKALVYYLNINSSNTLKAYFDFNIEVNKMLNEKLNNLNSDVSFNKLESMLKTSIQRSRGTKRFIDIDIDFDGDRPPEAPILSFFEGYSYAVITSQGGYHILIEVERLRAQKINLKEELDKFKRQFKVKDCSINKNQMVPIPGTYQAGKRVGVKWIY